MIDSLEKEGYFVAKGLLNPESDIQCVKDAYLTLIDTMAHAYFAQENRPLIENYEGYSLAEKFAIAMGASGGLAFEHLSPALNIQFDSFRWQSNLPSAQLPELFALIRHPKILDALEGVLGGEIFAMSTHLLNFKLTKNQLQLMSDTAANMHKEILPGFRYGLQLTETPWHRDPNVYTKNVLDSQVIIAWIPFSPTNEENGCLKVIPGSHKRDLGTFPIPEELTQDFVSLPVEVGDVIFMSDKTYHASYPNISKTQHRWAFNFRYSPVGQATYQPYLPGFIARSRSRPERELRDAEKWRLMWNSALAYHQHRGCPLGIAQAKTMSIEEGKAFAHFWNALTPDHNSWLVLS